VNSAEQIGRCLRRRFPREWRTAVAAAKEIWTTPMEATDIAVVYPATRASATLAAPPISRIAVGDAMTAREWVHHPGPFGGRWMDPGFLQRSSSSTAEQFALKSEEMARRMVRSQGNLRSWSNTYVPKVIMERKPVFLCCDGFTNAEARHLGSPVPTGRWTKRWPLRASASVARQGSILRELPPGHPMAHECPASTTSPSS